MGEAKKKISNNMTEMSNAVKNATGMNKDAQKKNGGASKKKSKIKGRPSLMNEEEKKVLKPLHFTEGAAYRSLELWNHKLENMLVILEAGENSKINEPLDEFQRVFR